MADVVLAAVISRLRREGRLVGADRRDDLIERPPLAALRTLQT
jgi:hypothetical protein